MSTKVFQLLLGMFGLVSAVLTLWYLERNSNMLKFEEKVSLKISIATLVFSLMMFTPLIDLRGGFIGLGIIKFPSTKIIADAIIMAFMASSLKDLIKKDMKDESD